MTDQASPPIFEGRVISGQTVTVGKVGELAPDAIEDILAYHDQFELTVRCVVTHIGGGAKHDRAGNEVAQFGRDVQVMVMRDQMRVSRIVKADEVERAWQEDKGAPQDQAPPFDPDPVLMKRVRN